MCQLRCHLPSPTGQLRQVLEDGDVSQYALTAFLADYSLSPTNKLVSRGFFDGLEILLANNQSPSSDLTNAAKIAAFASLGNQLNKPDLINQANMLYSDVLSSFQITMSESSTTNTIESLTTAILLGLFEVIEIFLLNVFASLVVTRRQEISANRTHPGDHGSHVQGVAAILSRKNSPIGRHPATQVFQKTGQTSEKDALVGPLMVISRVLDYKSLESPY